MDSSSQWQAVLARDVRYAGSFVYGVQSTGIYCRPTCSSRRPRRDRVRFFSDPVAAEQAGFRACRRCHPNEPASDPRLDRIRRACDFIAADPERLPTLAEVGTHVGLSPYHLQRTFKKLTGVSPREYAEACRVQRLKTGLRSGHDVTRANRDGDAKLAQQAAQCVEARGAGPQPRGANPMQRCHGLLRLRFDRHRMDLFVPRRFQLCAGIGPVGLGAPHIPAGLVRRE